MLPSQVEKNTPKVANKTKKPYTKNAKEKETERNEKYVSCTANCSICFVVRRN